MLTELQAARIRFHLGYPAQRSGFVEVTQKLVLGDLSPVTLTQVIGDLSEPVIEVSGETLAAEASVLGRVELAYQRLGPQTIDDSLFVKQAGSVTLRGDELRARQALYDTMVAQLAQLLDVEIFGSKSCGPSFQY